MIPPTLRAKLEDKGRNLYRTAEKNKAVSRWVDVENRGLLIDFMQGAESLYALLRETTPDDEKDAESYLHNQCKTAFTKTAYEAFLAGRSGTVPKAQVEKMIKAERERCAAIVREWNSDHPSGAEYHILNPESEVKS